MIWERDLFSRQTTAPNKAKAAQEWLQNNNNNINVLLWPSQSHDLSPNENLWQDLKIAAHSPVAVKLDRVCAILRTGMGTDCIV